MTVWVRMDGDVIGDVSFQGAGCAISKASASLMTGAVKGKSRAEARGAVRPVPPAGDRARLPAGESETLGKLAVFSGVSEFPIRVKCASLSWHTLKAALERGRSGVRSQASRPVGAATHGRCFTPSKE